MKTINTTMSTRVFLGRVKKHFGSTTAKACKARLTPKKEVTEKEAFVTLNEVLRPNKSPLNIKPVTFLSGTIL